MSKNEVPTNWTRYFDEAVQYFQNDSDDLQKIKENDLISDVTSICFKLSLNVQTPTVVGNYMMTDTILAMLYQGKISH